MSVQPKTIQETEIPVLPPEGSNIVALNGKEREIELIKIDDPAALDAEIQKNQALKKSKRTKEMVLVAASIIAATIIAIVSIGALLSGAPFWIAPVLQIAMLSTVIPIGSFFPQAHREKQEEFFQKIEDLQACQKAMGTEEFRVFARSYFGDALEVGQLLKVHTLFKRRGSFNQSLPNYYKDLNDLRKQICPGTGVLFCPGVGI